MKRQSILVLAVFSIAVLGICECVFAHMYDYDFSTLYASRQGFGDLSLYDEELVWGTVTLDVGGGVASYIVDIYDSAVSSVYGAQEYYIHHFSFETSLSLDLTNLTILYPSENWTIRNYGVDSFDGEIALYDNPTSPFHSLSMVVNNVPFTAVDSDFLEVNSLVQRVYGFATPWGVGLRFPNNNISGLPNTLYLYSNPVSLDPEVIPAPSAVILGSIGLTFSGWLLHRRKTA